ncbi:MAG: EAL domain-containing protein [Thiobacillus sp.]
MMTAALANTAVPSRADWLVFVVGLAGIVAGMVGVQVATDPGRAVFFENLHWTAATTAAALLAWRAWRRVPAGSNRAGLGWMAAGFGFYGIGQFVWDAQSALGYHAFPSPSDFFYLMLGPCLAIGLAYYIRTSPRRVELRPLVLDVGSLAIAILTLTLVLYIPRQGELGGWAMAVLVAYPVDLMLVVCIGLIMIPTLRLRPSPGLVLFLLGIGVNAAAWMHWNLLALVGAPLFGLGSNVVFSYAILLSGFSMTLWRLEYSDSPRWDRRCEGFLRLLPLLAVILAGTAVLAAELSPGTPQLVRTLTLVGSLAVILFAVLRQGELLKERDRLNAAQAEVLRSQRLLQTVIDTVPAQVYWKDRAGRYLGGNLAFARAAGLAAPDELVGKDDATLGHAGRVGRHPEADAWVLADGQARLGIEHHDLTADGEETWLNSTHVPLRDPAGGLIGVLGLVEDITARKQLALQLQRSEQMLKDILENVSAYIYLKDTKGRYLFANRMARELWNADMEDIVGRDDSAFFDAASVAAIRRNDRRVLVDGETVSCEETNTVSATRQTAVYWSVKLPLRREDGSIYALCGISTDITALKQHEKQLETIAHYDALTGVPNRVLLGDRMQHALAQCRRDGSLLVVAYLDLDGFKPINDGLGHAAGDRVLVEVSRRLQSVLRGGDTIARLGGDEFVVLLQGLGSLEECRRTLIRMLDAIAVPIATDGHTLSVTASIGAAIYPADDADADTLLRHADQAMYAAKQQGKNRYHLYDPEQDARTRTRHALQNEVREALAARQFELFYQPKVDLRSGRWVGAEALIRWNHPERGLLAPGQFLRAIEETELDVELGEWVIEAALRQLQAWLQRGLDVELSINVSAHHLQSPSFVDRLRQQLAQVGIAPRRRLQIEVLETTALRDLGQVQRIIEACHRLGVGFALDDFGTGYSSLTYLSKLPIDTLKVDQSFVRDMLEDPGDYAIIQGIVALSRAFGRSLVAEGIETVEQRAALMELGCGYGQGYLIARPMPIGEFDVWRTTQPR